jgi:hypothetical protein
LRIVAQIRAHTFAKRWLDFAARLRASQPDSSTSPLR